MALTVVPVVAGSLGGIFGAIRSIYRLVSAEVGQAMELSLNVTDGRVFENHPIPRQASGKCFIFFQTSRHLIEGEIVLRLTVPPVTRGGWLN